MTTTTYAAEAARDSGVALLHVAIVERNGVGKVRAILDAGADLLLPTMEKGRTPLHLAAATGQCEIIDLLLERGAALDALDKQGRSPLHLAVICGTDEAVEHLLKKGANANLVDGEMRTPLDYAEELRDAAKEEQRRLKRRR